MVYEAQNRYPLLDFIRRALRVERIRPSYPLARPILFAVLMQEDRFFPVRR